MKIKYLLKKKGNTPYPIYIALYDKDQTEIIATGGQRCSKDDWNKKEHMPKDQDGEVFYAIEKVKKAVQKVKQLMEATDQPVTPFTLKQAYLQGLKQKEEKQHHQDKKEKINLTSISSLVDKWTKTGLDNYKPLTQKAIKHSLKGFKEYLKNSGQPNLERKELNADIITAYARHLQVKKKYKDSTHGRFMKHLRWFLKFIKYDNSPISEIKVRSVKPTQRNIIHLTSSELTKLELVDVSFSSELQKAKDMFLLGCYTGLRISDLKRISRHRLENGSIELTLTKNSTKVSIPLLAQTNAILQRYDSSAPKISEQKVNEAIKKVCAKAEIDAPTFFKSVKGGVLIEKLHPKHELITTHCAGKTFISLAGKRWNLTPVNIAAIVGKDVKTVLGYYMKPDLEEAKQRMIEGIEAENRAQMKVS